MAKSKRPASQISGIDAPLAELLEDLAELLRTDPATDVESFLQEHAAFAERIRPLLPAVTLMAELGRSETGGVGMSAAGSVADLGEAGVLGDFRIHHEIGRGGMGVVYEAFQISLNRRVALKILPFAAMLDSRHLARFRNEAQAAAQLHHTNIVPVFAVGSERNVYYYAMQYIAGRTLDAMIAELRGTYGVHRNPFASPDNLSQLTQQLLGHLHSSNPKFENPRTSSASTDQAADVPRSPSARDTTPAAHASTSTGELPREYFKSVAELGIQAAEALDYAHEHGIVHRDIKPSNLLLDEDGNLWVTDFGLARIESESNLTMTGDVLGTLRYMSPEQALAKRPLIDHRTDIYSLGVTLYELLTLQPAFPETDRRELLRQIADEDPRSLRRVNRSIPAELETILQKAIEKDPSARYETAQDLAIDLRHFLEDKPIRARSPNLRDRVVKWSRRHRLLVRALLAMCAVSMVSATVALVLIDRARQDAQTERTGREADQKLVRAAQESNRVVEYIAKINHAWRHWKLAQSDEARKVLSQCIAVSGEEDLRSVEWHYLWQVTRPPVDFVGRHRGEVYFIVNSPAGRWLATGGQDGARIWDYETKELIKHLTDHIGDIGGLAFSPDGRWMATGGEDGTARIWNTATWQTENLLPMAGEVFALAWSADGKTLGSARKPFDLLGQRTGENSMQFWDTDMWKSRDVLPGEANRLPPLARSPDDSLLVVRGENGKACIWDLETGTIKYELATSEAVSRAVFANRRPLLAVVSVSGTVSLWNVQDGTLVSTIPNRMRAVEGAVFSHDDMALAAICKDRYLYVWENRGDGTLVNANVFHDTGRLLYVTFAHNDNDTILTANQAGEIHCWHRRQSQDHVRIASRDRWPMTARFSPDGRWLITAPLGLQAYPVAELDRPIALGHEDTNDWDPAFSPDGRLMAAYNRNVGITIWETGRWAQLQRFPVKGSRFRRLDFVEGLRLLRFEPEDAPVQFFDVDTGQHVEAPVIAGAMPATASSGSNDGTFMATRKGTVLEVFDGGRRMWTDVAQGTEWTAHAFSKDGSRLAAARGDGTIHVWNTADDTSRSICVGAVQRPTKLAFSPDRRTLVSEGPDDTVVLWNVATGRELLALDSHLVRLDSVEFAPDGSMLVAYGWGPRDFGQAIIWHTGPREE